jgi:hypothetical protein
MKGIFVVDNIIATQPQANSGTVTAVNGTQVTVNTPDGQTIQAQALYSSPLVGDSVLLTPNPLGGYNASNTAAGLSNNGNSGGLMVSISMPINKTDLVTGNQIPFGIIVQNGSGNYTCAWTFIQGTTTIATGNSTMELFTPGSTGGYSANVTVTDTSTGAIGCCTVQFEIYTPSGSSGGGPLGTMSVSIVSSSTMADLYVNNLLAFASDVVGGTSPYTYSWVIDGGSPIGGAVTAKSFSTSGLHTIVLTVTDSASHTAVATYSINIATSAPSTGGGPLGTMTANIVMPADMADLYVNNTFQFGSNVVGGTAPYTYAWTIDGTGQGNNPVITGSFSGSGAHKATLTVTDSASHTAVATQEFYIYPSAPTMNFTPSGALPCSAETSTIFEGTTGLTPQFFETTASPSLSDVTLISGTSGKRIRVIALFCVCGATATTIQFYDGSTAITGTIPNGANGGMVLPFNPVGWFQTSAGNALAVSTGAGSNTSINLVYVLA